ncbi:hypothetical protein NL676_009775 [Syzygium grande]|nr:hypothetical protein NL676_009775 [Syzygium grande]
MASSHTRSIMLLHGGNQWRVCHFLPDDDDSWRRQRSSSFLISISVWVCLSVSLHPLRPETPQVVAALHLGLPRFEAERCPRLSSLSLSSESSGEL